MSTKQLLLTLAPPLRSRWRYAVSSPHKDRTVRSSPAASLGWQLTQHQDKIRSGNRQSAEVNSFERLFNTAAVFFSHRTARLHQHAPVRSTWVPRGPPRGWVLWRVSNGTSTALLSSWWRSKQIDIVSEPPWDAMQCNAGTSSNGIGYREERRQRHV